MEPVSRLGTAILFPVQLKSPVTSLEETFTGVFRKNAVVSLENQVQNDKVDGNFCHH